jgi:hypothetical protein
VDIPTYGDAAAGGGGIADESTELAEDGNPPLVSVGARTRPSFDQITD